MPKRLKKFLREALRLPQPSLEQLCRDGRVRVHPVGWPPGPNAGRIPWIGAPHDLVFPGDLIQLDQRSIEPVAPQSWYCLHKPWGVTSTTNDPHGAPDLRPWLDQLPPGAFPVGRLDRDTTGMLLLTDDGDLTQALLNPVHQVEKEYRLRLRRPVAPDDPRIQQWLTGLDLDGRPARALRVWTPAADVVHLVLAEGRHRQVRRMCHAVGLRLLDLERVRIGPLRLPPSAPGSLHALSPQEVVTLWQSVGGPQAVWERQVRALASFAARQRTTGRPDRRLELWLAQAGAPAGGPTCSTLASP